MALPRSQTTTRSIRSTRWRSSESSTYAALAGQLALAWLSPTLAPLRGTVLVLGLTHGLLILACYLYTELPAAAAGVLALAPGAAWAGAAGPLKRLSKLKSLAVSLILVVLVSGAAAGIAHSAAPEFDDPYAPTSEGGGW